MAEDYYDENKPTRKSRKLPSRTMPSNGKAMPKKTMVRENVVKSAAVPKKKSVGRGR